MQPVVRGQDFLRHKRRCHGNDSSTVLSDPYSDATESDSSVRGSSLNVKNKRVKTTSSSTPVAPDFLRDAVLCMLRRNSGINQPALSKYLMTFFPEIPSEWHVPLIVATFTAAQKVAATYAETVFDLDDGRSSAAKKSLSKWMHGLSAVEPGRVAECQKNGESGVSSANSVDLDVYSPTRNFLVNRQVPVPLNSLYQQSQLNAELEQSYAEISSVPSQPTPIQVNLQSSVTLEQMLSMPVFPLVTSTAAAISSDSSNQSPEDANSISEATNQVLVGTTANNSETDDNEIFDFANVEFLNQQNSESEKKSEDVDTQNSEILTVQQTQIEDDMSPSLVSKEGVSMPVFPIISSTVVTPSNLLSQLPECNNINSKKNNSTVENVLSSMSVSNDVVTRENISPTIDKLQITESLQKKPDNMDTNNSLNPAECQNVSEIVATLPSSGGVPNDCFATDFCLEDVFEVSSNVDDFTDSLPCLLSPISTPVRHIVKEPEIQLHPSPISSLEESSTPLRV